MFTQDRLPPVWTSPARHDEPLFFDRDGSPFWIEADREDGTGVLLDLPPAFNTCQCQEHEVEEHGLCLGCGTVNVLGF